MTLSKLNELRGKSQHTRDQYYEWCVKHPEPTHAAVIMWCMWQDAQEEARVAVMEWIAQGCMEHIDYGVGRCFINGKELFTIKAVSYKFDF